MRYLNSTIAGLTAFLLGVYCIDLDGLEGYEAFPEPSGNKYLSEDLAEDLPVQTDLPLSARAISEGVYSYEPTHVPDEDLHPGSKSMHDYFHGKHRFPHVARGLEKDFDDEDAEFEEHFRMLMAREAEDTEVDWDAYPPVPPGADASILSARDAEEVNYDAYPPVPAGGHAVLFARDAEEEMDYDAYPPVPMGADTGKILARNADDAEIDYDAYPPVPAGADTGKIFARNAGDAEVDYDAYPPVPAGADAGKIFARDAEEEIDYDAYPPVPAGANTLFARDAEEIDYNAYPPVPAGADATTLLARDLTDEELHEMQAREAEPEAEPIWYHPSKTHSGTWPAHTHPTAPPTEQPLSEPYHYQQHEHQHSMFARAAAPSESAKSEKTKSGWFNFFTKGKDLADEPARRHHPRLVNVGYKGGKQSSGAHESRSHVSGGHWSHHTPTKTRSAI